MSTAASESTVQRVLDIMQDGKPRHFYDVAAILQMSPTTMGKALEMLHDRGELFIYDFVRAPHSSRYRLIFKRGSDPDKPHPDNYKSADRRMREMLARERVWLEESRASGKKIFRHPQDVAFFGEYAT